VRSHLLPRRAGFVLHGNADDADAAPWDPPPIIFTRETSSRRAVATAIASDSWRSSGPPYVAAPDAESADHHVAAALPNPNTVNIRARYPMKTKAGLLAAVICAMMLSACAATGTRVSTSSEAYRGMANSQQPWCGTFAETCACSIDGVHTTCSLGYACLNTGNCRTSS